MPVATPGSFVSAPSAKPDKSKRVVCTCLCTNDNIISHVPVAPAGPFVPEPVAGPGVSKHRCHIEFTAHSHLAKHARFGAACVSFVQTSGRSMLSSHDAELSWPSESWEISLEAPAIGFFLPHQLKMVYIIN